MRPLVKPASAPTTSVAAALVAPPPPDDATSGTGYEREYASAISLKRKADKKDPIEYQWMLEFVRDAFDDAKGEIKVEIWKKKPELGYFQASYHDPQGREWQVVPESVNTGSNDGYEFVTPILRGAEDHRKLTRILQQIETSGVYELGIRSGMHINQGVEPYFEQALLQAIAHDPSRQATLDKLRHGDQLPVADLEKLNVHPLWETILHIEESWKSIYSAFSPIRYGTIVNRFGVPLAMKWPELLAKMAATPPEERTYGKLRELFMEFDKAEYDSQPAEFSHEKKLYNSWKNFACQYKKLLGLHAEEMIPVIEGRFPDPVAPERLSKLGELFGKIVLKGWKMRKSGSPFRAPFKPGTTREAANWEIYDLPAQEYAGWLARYGYDAKEFPKLRAMDGPPSVGLGQVPLQKKLDAIRLKGAPSETVELGNAKISLERAVGEKLAVLRMTVPRGTFDAMSLLNVEAWLDRMRQAVEAVGYSTGDRNLKMVYRIGDKMDDGGMVVEFRGSPDRAESVELYAKKFLVGVKSPALIRGFPAARGEFSGPRESLPEFYDRYFKKYSNLRLTTQKRIFLERLDAVTSRFAYPLYGFHEAPFLSKMERVYIANQTLEFYKSVMKLVNSPEVAAELRTFEGEGMFPPHIPRLPQEIVDRYARLLEEFASSTNLAAKLDRSLLSYQAGGRGPETQEERFALENFGRPRNFGRNLGYKSYVPVTVNRVNPKYFKVLARNTAYFLERGVPVPSEAECYEMYGWAVKTEASIKDNPPDFFLDETRVMYAVRYGAGGLKRNFGDARRLTSGGYSFKGGIGVTPLLRHNPQGDHADGKVPFEEGGREMIAGEEMHRSAEAGGDRMILTIAFERFKDREPDTMIVGEETLRGAYFIGIHQGQGKKMRESDPYRLMESHQYLEDALPLQRDIRVTADRGALDAGLLEATSRFAEHYASLYPMRVHPGTASASNIQIDGKGNDYGTLTVQEKWAAIQMTKGVSAFGDLGGPSEFQLKWLLNTVAYESGWEVTPERVDELMGHFWGHFDWALNREMAKLTAVPGPIADELENSPLTRDLAGDLRFLAREGSRFIKYQYVTHKANREKLVKLMGKYDLKDILRDLAFARSSDPAKLDAAIAKALPDAGARESLVRKYVAYVNEAMRLAAEQGMPEARFRNYMVENATLLLKSVPELDRPWMIEEGQKAKQRFFQGDRWAIQDFIDMTVATSARRYEGSSATLIVYDQVLDERSETFTRYFYDGVAGEYGARIIRFGTRQKHAVIAQVDGGRFVPAEAIETAAGIEYEIVLPSREARITEFKVRGDDGAWNDAYPAPVFKAKQMADIPTVVEEGSSIKGLPCLSNALH